MLCYYCLYIFIVFEFIFWITNNVLKRNELWTIFNCYISVICVSFTAYKNLINIIQNIIITTSQFGISRIVTNILLALDVCDERPIQNSSIVCLLFSNVKNNFKINWNEEARHTLISLMDPSNFHIINIKYINR